MLLLLFCLAAAGAARADDDPTLSLDVSVGLGGNIPSTDLRGNNIPTEDWIPIRVRVKNAGPDLQGELTATARGAADGTERMPMMRPVDVPSRSHKEFWLYGRLPSLGTLSVRVAGGGRERSSQITFGGNLLPRVIGVIGPTPDILNDLRRGTALAHVCELAAADLPDRWIGYDSAEWIIIVRPEAISECRPEQIEALVDWVRAGGRLAVVAAKGRATAVGRELVELLPARLGEIVECDSAASLATFAESAPPEWTRFAVTTLTECRGVVLAEAEGHPMLVRGRAGLGEVQLLAFDPDGAPFRGWEGMERVWTSLSPGSSRRPPSGLDSSMSPWYIRSLLELQPVGEPITLGWLALLLGVYVLILFPGDWILARRLRRPRLMWATAVVWALLSGVCMYAMSVRGRSTSLSLRRISVVDVDGDGGGLRGQTWAALYTPSPGSFEIKGTGPSAHVDLVHEVSSAYSTGMTDVASDRETDVDGGISDQREGASIRSLWMWGAMMKHFEMQWIERPGDAHDVRARIHDGILSVESHGTVSLSSLVLLGRNSAWIDLGDLDAGQAREIRLGKPLKKEDPRANEPHAWIRAAREDAREGEDSERRRCEDDILVSIYGTIGWPVLMNHAASFRGDDDVDALWLASGGKILLARASASPQGLRVVGEDPELMDVTVVRVFIK